MSCTARVVVHIVNTSLRTDMRTAGSA